MDGTGQLAKATRLAVQMFTSRKSTILCLKRLTQYVAGRSRIHRQLRLSHGIILSLIISPMDPASLKTTDNLLPMLGLSGR